MNFKIKKRVIEIYTQNIHLKVTLVNLIHTLYLILIYLYIITFTNTFSINITAWLLIVIFSNLNYFLPDLIVSLNLTRLDPHMVSSFIIISYNFYKWQIQCHRTLYIFLCYTYSDIFRHFDFFCWVDNNLNFCASF